MRTLIQIITIGLVIQLFSCSGSASKQDTKTYTPEYMLTFLDVSEKIKETDKRVIVIKKYLDTLSLIYNEPIDTIAEYTSRAQVTLQQRGFRYSNSSILKNMCFYSKNTTNLSTKYKEVINLWAAKVNKEENY